LTNLSTIAAKPVSRDFPTNSSRPAVRQRLTHWPQDNDLFSLRSAGIDKLPEAEREPWRKLWADVNDSCGDVTASKDFMPRRIADELHGITQSLLGMQQQGSAVQRAAVLARLLELGRFQVRHLPAPFVFGPPSLEIARGQQGQGAVQVGLAKQLYHSIQIIFDSPSTSRRQFHFFFVLIRLMCRWPHSHITSVIGRSVLPYSVSEYSTFGGTSG
jgi:hypothetical protein